MTRARAALALALVALGLAGCTAENPQLQGTPPAGFQAGPSGAGNGTAVPGAPVGPDLANASADNLVLPAPLWTKGDAWRFNLDADGQTAAQQLVVVSDLGADYLVADTDAADAVASAFDGRSLPGRVNKGFLSGYDAGLPTRYFDFPLQQNKTWTLHILGTDFAVAANFSRDVDGHGPGFVVQGASAAGGRVEAAYGSDVLWMTRFFVTTGPNGTTVTRTLASFTANYTGPYYVARVEDLYVGAHNATSPAAPVDSFDVGRPYTQLRLSLRAAGTGVADVHVLDPAGQPRFNFTTGGQGSAGQDADLPGLPGAWRVTYALAGQVAVSLRIAGVDVQAGTL